MSDAGLAIAFTTCAACPRRFACDPDNVPTVLLDPVTGLPPDLGGDASRASSRAVCASCAREVNAIRASCGQPPAWSEALIHAAEEAEQGRLPSS